MADQHSCKLSDLQVKYILVMHEQVENCKFILSQGQYKSEKNPHAKPQVHSFTVMLIIIPVKFVDSNSSDQGTNNTT
jgi:hypothetical protein